MHKVLWLNVYLNPYSLKFVLEAMPSNFVCIWLKSKKFQLRQYTEWQTWWPISSTCIVHYVYRTRMFDLNIIAVVNECMGYKYMNRGHFVMVYRIYYGFPKVIPCSESFVHVNIIYMHFWMRYFVECTGEWYSWLIAIQLLRF